MFGIIIILNMKVLVLVINKDLTLEEQLDKLKPYLRDIMINYDINDKLSVSLRSKYQGNSETSMERSRILHAFKTEIL